MNPIAEAVKDKKEPTARQPAWFAKLDAEKKNKLHEKNFDVRTHSLALRIKVYAELAFPDNRVYLTNRKEFIAIKVEHVQLCDALTQYAEILADLCKLQNVSIHANGNNVLFHVAPV